MDFTINDYYDLCDTIPVISGIDEKILLDNKATIYIFSSDNAFTNSVYQTVAPVDTIDDTITEICDL